MKHIVERVVVPNFLLHILQNSVNLMLNARWEIMAVLPDNIFVEGSTIAVVCTAEKIILSKQINILVAVIPLLISRVCNTLTNWCHHRSVIVDTTS